MQTEYVCGFAFSKLTARGQSTVWVLLIRKAKPEWQRGKLNGIGGKIEPGETVCEAQSREFHEETGLLTTSDQWTLYHVERFLLARVFFLYTEVATEEMETAIELTAVRQERCVIREVGSARGTITDRKQDALYNVPYLLSMARATMSLSFEHRPRFEVDPARDVFPLDAGGVTELERLRGIVGQVQRTVGAA